MTDKAISPLRRRLIEDMAIRRLSPKTQLRFLHAQSQALPADRDHAPGRPGARPFGPGCGHPHRSARLSRLSPR